MHNTITLWHIPLHLTSGCDPALLGNDTQATQLMSVCGASHMPLSINNGFVCYSGTSTGSNAFYYCFDCGYNTINKSAGSFIRTCKSSGKWDGAIPHCDCSKWCIYNLFLPLVIIIPVHLFNDYIIGHISLTSSQSGVGIITGFTAFLLLLFGLLITLIGIIVFLLKIKAKLTLELKKEKDKNTIYDVIDVIDSTPIPQARVDTAVNIAYTNITKS